MLRIARRNPTSPRKRGEVTKRRDVTMTSMLEMRGVSKSFAGVRALRDVNFTVNAGEIHALVGENGAGKSTLMKVLSGVHPAGTYSGEIVYRGEEVRFGDIRASE